MSNILPNVHHLELFYHVAKHGGITPASRAMPYGIQQPAISGQIAALEEEMGVRLFQRRPFQLTEQGEELYAFVRPFFGELGNVAASIAGRGDRVLRLAAPATAMRDHLPQALAKVREKIPDLELRLTEATYHACCTLLEEGGIDLAVAEIPGKPPAGMQTEVLAELELALVVPGRRPGIISIEKLISKWKLIRPPKGRLISELFYSELKERNLDWDATIEAGSLEAVHAFAIRGFGVGLTVVTPSMKAPSGTWFMRLRDFPRLSIGGLWRGPLNRPGKALLDVLREQVPV